jgi:poly-gamma-glutamate capsule biosynthesis protein CapA/YwtB (metallophosphatase superfamily)
MTGRIYMSFSEVERDTKLSKFSNEPELRQALVEALKEEVGKYCKKDLAEYVFRPMLERVLRERRRADIIFSNVVIEVENPGGDLSRGREQLYTYMNDLKSRIKELVIHGVVTNGIDAEYYVLDDDHPRLIKTGSLSDVMSDLLTLFCSQKIPIITSEELLSIIGV